MVFLYCFWINGQAICEWRGNATTWLNNIKALCKNNHIIVRSVQEMSFNQPFPGLVRRSEQVDGISIISSGGYGWFSVVGRSYICRIFPDKFYVLYAGIVSCSGRGYVRTHTDFTAVERKRIRMGSVASRHRIIIESHSAGAYIAGIVRTMSFTDNGCSIWT